MIFASNAKQYGAAIEALAAADAHIVFTHGTLRSSVQFEELLDVSGGAEADSARLISHRARDLAKF
jgi:hypothetical protein